MIRLASTAAAVAMATAVGERTLSGFAFLDVLRVRTSSSTTLRPSLRAGAKQSTVIDGEAIHGGAGMASGVTCAVGASVMGAAALVQARRRSKASRSQNVVRGPFRRDLTLDGYPVQGPGYYWTLQKDTEAVIVYVPIADDVNSRDIEFSCREGQLRLGMTPEKGGLVIDDQLIYKVDIEESYYVIDTGEFGERCIACHVYKLTKEQDWYAYDRFDPVSERFLTESEKSRASLDTTVTHRTYFDVEKDGKPLGRIICGLWGDLVPRTVENFRCLCTGEKGESEDTGLPLSYKGTKFHRVIKDFCIQGGETFDDGEGSGGESIYGLTFEDENLRVKFRKPFQLAMANGGPDTNGSQFFILTGPADHLSHHCVGFGTIMEGRQIVEQMEKCGTADGDPINELVITDCGELPMGDK